MNVRLSKWVSKLPGQGGFQLQRACTCIESSIDLDFILVVGCQYEECTSIDSMQANVRWYWSLSGVLRVINFVRWLASIAFVVTCVGLVFWKVMGYIE